MRRLLALCAAATMSTVVAHAQNPEGTMTVETAPAEAASQHDDYALGAWQLYRSIFMVDSGRIVDRENGSISHSEGQGYGMLIAATLGDRDAFDKIWNWTEQELLVRDDSLAAWKWDPSATPHVTDMNNATDGDILIAWALLRAYRAWGVPDHLREAQAIVDDIVSKTLADTKYGAVILPGAQGFSAKDRADGPVVNASYWVFPAIAELSEEMPELARADLDRSGLEILRQLVVSERRLPSEWTATGRDELAPADGFDPVFGYNALRIPLYLAWSRHAEPEILQGLETAWASGGETGLAVTNVETGNPVEPIDGQGYAAIRELIECGLGQQPSLSATRSFEPSSYYASTLQLLTLIALSERYPRCS